MHSRFFKEHIQYKFLDEDFVFDIYRDSRGKVWLIGFNPFGEITDSLLFSWEDLTSDNNLKGDFSEGMLRGRIPTNRGHSAAQPLSELLTAQGLRGPLQQGRHSQAHSFS